MPNAQHISVNQASGSLSVIWNVILFCCFLLVEQCVTSVFIWGFRASDKCMLSLNECCGPIYSFIYSSQQDACFSKQMRQSERHHHHLAVGMHPQTSRQDHREKYRLLSAAVEKNPESLMLLLANSKYHSMLSPPGGLVFFGSPYSQSSPPHSTYIILIWAE